MTGRDDAQVGDVEELAEPDLEVADGKDTTGLFARPPAW